MIAAVLEAFGFEKRDGGEASARKLSCLGFAPAPFEICSSCNCRRTERLEFVKCAEPRESDTFQRLPARPKKVMAAPSPLDASSTMPNKQVAIKRADTIPVAPECADWKGQSPDNGGKEAGLENPAACGETEN